MYSWTAIAAATSYTMAIRSDGSLWTWGGATAGTLGTGGTIARSSPVQLGSDSWLNISASDNAALAIRNDYTLWSWGVNSSLGQLGLGVTVARSSPTQVFTPYWSMIGGGINHTAAVKSDGTLWVWGLNSSGQLGLNDTISRSSPVQLPTGPGLSWNYVARTNTNATYALTSGTTNAYAWGDNFFGQLGDGTTASRSQPVQVSGIAGLTATQITAGSLLLSINSVFVWGANTNGQLGLNDTVSRSTPVQLVGLNYNSIPNMYSGSHGHNAFIDTTFRLWATGSNGSGQLGQNDTISRSSPVQVTAALDVVYAIGDEAQQTMFLTRTGSLFMTGQGLGGRLGDGTAITRSQPVQVYGQYSWSSIANGRSTIRAVRSDGTLWTWGLNDVGQLGVNDLNPRSFPVQVGTEKYWSQVFPGTPAMALTNDNRLFAWGSNTDGSLGDGTTISRSSPVQIPGSWIMTFGSNNTTSNPRHTIGIRTNRTVFTWGSNESGQLGTNDTISRSSPVQVLSGVTNSFIQVVAGGQFSLFLDSSGTLYSTGLNTNGHLGDNSTVARSSPVQIGAIGAWRSTFGSIAAGSLNSYAISSTGLLFAWGQNTFGQIGDGTTINRSSPVQIGALTNWTTLYSAFSNGIAQNNLGTIFTWGINSTGELGENTTVSRSSPVQLGAIDTTVSFAQVVQIGPSAYGAVTTDFRLYTWGLNDSRILGTGDATTVSRSKPVQILSNVRVSYLGGIPLNAIESSAYAMSVEGLIYAWGNNPSNVFNNPNSTISSPTLVGLSLSNNKPYPLTNNFMNRGSLSFADGQNILYIWGPNNNGVLGDGTTVAKSSPLVLSAGTSTSWVSVSAGLSWSTGSTSDGKIITWGGNDSYQLGQTDLIARSFPTQIPVASGTSFVQVVADRGTGFGLAIDNNNKLYGWGNNSNGQLGNISHTTMNIRFGDSTLPAYITSIGNNTGLLYTWGVNPQGQLGQNDLIARSSPVQVPGNWSFVAGAINPSTNATYHVMGIKQDGSLWAWGLNSNGQFGNSSTINRSYPILVDASKSWVFVAGTQTSTYAIDSSGFLFSWGNNTSGQLGDNTTISKSSPVQLGTNTWLAVSCGLSSIAAIRSDNTLWVWGVNSVGQLGLNDTINRSSPVQVPGSWNSVSTANANMAAIDINFKLFTWGSNSSGAIGDGNTVGRSSPIQVPSLGLSSFSMVTTGAGATIALTVDGKLWGMGGGFPATLAQNDAVSRSTPVQIGANYYWTSVRGMGSVVLAQDINNRLYVWGTQTNSPGVLGLNTTTDRSSPVQLNSGLATFVPLPTQIGNSSWIQVAAGVSFSTGITSDNRLFAWGTNTVYQSGLQSTLELTGGNFGTGILKNDGMLMATGNPGTGQLGIGLTSLGTNTLNIGYTGQDNTLKFKTGTYKRFTSLYISAQNKLYAAGSNAQGQLGDGTVASKSNPTQIGDNSWSMVDATDYGSMSMAIRSDGTLWAWGYNQYAQFGSSAYGQNTMVSSPVQIGTSSWTTVCVGDQFVLALKADNTLWAWGRNDFGQLAQNYTNLNNTLSWSIVSTSGFTTYAIRSDGKLFAWGANNQGQIGDGSTINRSTPVQITTSSFVQVSAGLSHALALTAAGNILAWGNNNVGQLGIGDYIARSQPVQVGIWSDTNAYTNVLHNSYVNIWQRGTNTYGFGIGTSLASPPGWWYGFPDTSARQAPALLSNNYSDFAIGNSASFAISSGVIIATGQWPGTGISLTTSSVQVAAIAPATSWTSVIKNTVEPNTTQFINGAIDNLGRLFVWGSGTFGAFGAQFAFNEQLPAPREWKPGTSFIQVASFQDSTNSKLAAITNTGALWVIGNNTNGDLGDGTTISRSSPVQIAGTWSQISMHQGGWIAVNSLGQVLGTGANTLGQLGQNDTINRSSPVQIATGTSFTQVYAGLSHAFAKTTTGTIFGWGSNVFGTLGDGTRESRSSPVQIGTSSWAMVSTGRYGTVGILNGNVYGWGITYFTAPAPYCNISLVNPTGVTTNALPALSPIQLTSYNTSTFSWSSVSAGATHSVAIRSDGTIWSWGNNSSGELATLYGNSGLYLNVPSPVPLIGGGSWTSISAGASFTLGIKTDGKLFGWGTNTRNQINVVGNSVTWISATANGGIKSDGSLWVWGASGSQGQLGDGFVSINRSSPVQIGSDTNWLQAEIGTAGGGTTTSHALKTDGTLWGWGLNTAGRIGDNTTISRSSPVQVAGTAGLSFTSMTCDEDGSITFAITNDKRLYVWGVASAAHGLNDTTVNRSSPVQVPGSWNSISIKAGNVLAIRDNSTLWAWGTNSAFGPLGLGDTSGRSSPVQVGTSSWSMVAMGSQAAGAIDINGRLFTWGSDANGQLGSITLNSHRSSPVQISSGISWTQIFAQGGASGTTNTTFFGFQLDTNKIIRSLWAWGNNAIGQIGDNTTANRSSPVQIGLNVRNTPNIGSTNPYGGGFGAPPTSITSFSRSSVGENVAFTDDNGNYWHWGRNDVAQLGDSSTSNRSSPFQIPAGTYITASTTAYPIVWERSSPVQIGAGNSFVSVAAGASTGAAITTDGRLFIWGDNGAYPIPAPHASKIVGNQVANFMLKNSGELLFIGAGQQGVTGTGDTITRFPWTLLTAGQGRYWLDFDTGYSASVFWAMGIKSDNKLYTWGDNSLGQLGQGNTFSRSSPVQLGTDNWIKVLAAPSNAFAIRSDNTLWAWGSNGGQIGDGTTVSRSSPVQIAGSWTNVWGKGLFTIGQRTDGTYWAWGNNAAGGYGNNTNVSASSPIQITSLTNVSHITVGGLGNGFVVYLNNLGQLFAWGDNQGGSIGDNTTVNKSSPVQVGVGRSWIQVAAGGLQVAALATDGTTWSWGRNDQGQLGDGTSTNRSSPVQVQAGLSFGQVLATYNQTYWLPLSQNQSNSGAIRYLGSGASPNYNLGDTTNVTKSSPVTVLSMDTAQAGMTQSDGFNSERLPIPTQIPGSWTQVSLLKFTSTGFMASAYNSASFGTKSDGSLWAWGNNTFAQLGLNSTIARVSPTQIGSLTNWTNSTSSLSNALIINSSGQLYGMGINTSGAIGQSDTLARSSPVQVNTGHFIFDPVQIPGSWKSIKAADSDSSFGPSDFAIALRTNNTLWGWGKNDVGQLGQNNTISRSSPVQIGTSYAVISSGLSSAAAIDFNNRLFVWGSNNNGVLGLNDTNPRSNPTQVGVNENFRKVTIGGTLHVTAFSDPNNPNNDNLIFGSGLNISGQLGDGTTTARSTLTLVSSIASNNSVIATDWNTLSTSSPVQISSFSWTSVSAGQSHAVGLATNGLYIWGGNNIGQLGDNSTINKSIPVLQSTLSTSLISAGLRNTLFVSMDPITGPRLMATGIGNFGQLGDNIALNRSAPVQVSFASVFNTSNPAVISTGSYDNYYIESPIQIGTSSWTSVSTGENFNLAINSSGLLFAWGYNAFGQVGDNTTINRSSPVQLSSLNSWTQISAGYSHSIVKNSNNNAYTFGSNSNGQLGDNT